MSPRRVQAHPLDSSTESPQQATFRRHFKMYKKYLDVDGEPEWLAAYRIWNMFPAGGSGMEPEEEEVEEEELPAEEEQQQPEAEEAGEGAAGEEAAGAAARSAELNPFALLTKPAAHAVLHAEPAARAEEAEDLMQKKLGKIALIDDYLSRTKWP